MRRAVAIALCVGCIAALLVVPVAWAELLCPARYGWRGPGSYTIQAQMPDVVTIQENTRVRVDDVNVGNVTKIEQPLKDGQVLVTMRINGDVHLPGNSTAKLGQTSLLGSMHMELAAPQG